MRFELIDNALHISAENPREVLQVFRDYRLDATLGGERQLASALTAGTYTHIDPGTKKRPWFQVDVYLPHALEPYRRLLERLTGYSGPLPAMDLTPAWKDRWKHTHIVNTASIEEDGALRAEVFIRAEDWNDQSAEVRAERNAADYVQEDVGKRRYEREYILMANGLARPNPDFGRKRHAAEPGLGAPWLWDGLFSWWRSTHATPGQLAILDAVDALRSGHEYPPDYAIRPGGGEEAELCGSVLYALDPAGTINYDGKGTMARVYTWEEFKEAK